MAATSQPPLLQSYPSRAVQRVLFFIPYVFTALTCVLLLLPPLLLDPSSPATTHPDDPVLLPVLRLTTGIVNTLLLLLYGIGWLGPHYLKIICGLINCTVVAVVMLRWWSVRADVGLATLLLGSYCLPAMLFVIQAVHVPSISEILPGIYLANRGAAFSPHLLANCRIRHILDLTHSTRPRPIPGRSSKNDSLVVKKVYVNDFLYSHGSLVLALDECMAFMVETRQQQPDAVILIHCSAGQSRSAAFLLYYLLEQKIMTNLPEAYAFLRKQRPVVDISSDHLGPLLRQYPPPRPKSKLG